MIKKYLKTNKYIVTLHFKTKISCLNIVVIEIIYMTYLLFKKYVNRTYVILKNIC